MLNIRHCLLIASLTLAGCITAPALQDSQSAALIETVRADSARHYAGLVAAAAPECSYEHNMNDYAQLHDKAGLLKIRLAHLDAGPVLLRAADALSRSIEGARLSHQLASARTNDVNGACMAQGAIALNAEAIARASRAIAGTQKSEGE